MSSPYFTEFPERDATRTGSTPDPISRKSGGPGAGKVGTYTHPKSGTPRKVHQVIGRRVKTSMLENY